MWSAASEPEAGQSRSPGRRLYSGGDLARAVTVDDLRAMAKRRLPAFVYEYLEGGAEQEATLSRNREAFADWRFIPRSLADVAHRDLSAEVLGATWPMPLAIAPTGLNGLFWRDADTELATAAAEVGIAFTQSTMSNEAMEKVASVPGLRHWFQLYVFGPPQVRAGLIERALDCGCEALVVTTDAQIYGNREWDRRNRVGQTALTWRAMLDTAMHPRWLAGTLLRTGMPSFDNILPFVPKDRQGFFESASWVRLHMDRSLSWRTIEDIRRVWPRVLIVKGLLRVDDIRRAKDAGADGVAISNHGGRQLDWAVSPLDVLPQARAAVGDGFTLLVDGGLRRGTDVVKAIALGADAVMLGRAVLYGVAAAGRAGAARAIEIVREETERTLGLLGAAGLNELGPHCLRRSLECGDG